MEDPSIRHSQILLDSLIGRTGRIEKSLDTHRKAANRLMNRIRIDLEQIKQELEEETNKVQEELQETEQKLGIVTQELKETKEILETVITRLTATEATLGLAVQLILQERGVQDPEQQQEQNIIAPQPVTPINWEEFGITFAQDDTTNIGCSDQDPERRETTDSILSRSRWDEANSARMDYNATNETIPSWGRE